MTSAKKRERKKKLKDDEEEEEEELKEKLMHSCNIVVIKLVTLTRVLVA